MSLSAPHLSRWIYFRDGRPPHTVQAHFERLLMALFHPRIEADRLVYQARFAFQEVAYEFRLEFLSAEIQTNWYGLRIEVAWKDSSSSDATNLGEASRGWVELWTRDLHLADAPDHIEIGDRYRRLTDLAMEAETRLATVSAVQQEVVRALRRGAMFRTAHKEGGTVIRFEQGRFLRADYGEWDTRQAFHDEPEFLTFLREFFDTETARNALPDRVPDHEAWRLILRLLDQGDSMAATGPSPELRVWFGSRLGTIALGIAVATGLIMILRIGYWLHDQTPPSEFYALYYPSLGAFVLSVGATLRPLITWAVTAMENGALIRRRTAAFLERGNRRAAELAADPDPRRRKYVPKVEQGEEWSNEEIDYRENPNHLATCQHLQPIERAMRDAGVELRRRLGAAVQAECVVDPALWQRRYPGVGPVRYVEIPVRDLPPWDRGLMAKLFCDDCVSSILVQHPKDHSAVPWFPAAP